MTGNYSTREYREKLYDDLHVRLSDTVILMCAIFIASIGLNMNSTAVIVGAMLISPLMTPIVGLGFGLAIFDTRLIKQSLEVLFTEVLVSLLVSTVFLDFSLILCKQRVDCTNLSNHLGCCHCYCWWDSRCHWFKEKRSKQYRARSSHRNSSNATYLYCGLWFS